MLCYYIFIFKKIWNRYILINKNRGLVLCHACNITLNPESMVVKNINLILFSNIYNNILFVLNNFVKINIPDN